MAQSFPFPIDPDAIAPDWVTSVLHDAGALSQGTVAAIRGEIIAEERGLSGVVARLHITYTDRRGAAPGPATLIAKFPMAERATASTYRERHRDDAAARRYYERCACEVRFYAEIVPQNVVPAPRCYFGAADDASGRIVLLLEDLNTARGGDVLLGCSTVEAESVLRMVAPLHARWWGRTDSFSWLLRWGGDYAARQERYRGQVEPFLRRFGAQIPDAIRALVVGLQPHYAAVLAALDDAPATVIHADLHLDNVLFNPESVAPPVVVLDWQSVCRGPAAVDIAQFVVGSLAPVSRRAAEAALLAEYHARLVAGGVMGYTMDNLRQDYRLALLWLLAGTVGWLASADMEHLAGRERALVEAAIGDGRLATALLDHEVISLLPA